MFRLSPTRRSLAAVIVPIALAAIAVIAVACGGDPEMSHLPKLRSLPSPLQMLPPLRRSFAPPTRAESSGAIRSSTLPPCCGKGTGCPAITSGHS